MGSRPKPAPLRIANRVRSLRFQGRELSQVEVAEAVGVTRQTILAIEKGKYTPTLEVAFRLARLFDVPLDEVFFCEPDPDDPPHDRRSRALTG